MGVVTAIDITHDPLDGVDGDVLSRALIKDDRVKYVIWMRQIWAKDKAPQGWRPYTGKNPHDHHVHISVSSSKSLYDDPAPWDVGIKAPVTPLLIVVPSFQQHQVLRLKSQGGDVPALQTFLGIHADGDFGPKTEAAVKTFQKAHKLVVDGMVGPYTWEALEAARPATEAPLGLIGTPNAIGSPQWTIGYLKSLGYSSQAAIALTAHLMWESGGARNRAIVWNAEGDNHHSHGAAQWNEKFGRYQNLLEFAEARGKSWDDPETQLLFLDSELRGSEMKTGTKLMLSATVQQAVKDALSFWRPGIPHTDKRIEIAERLEKEMADASSSDPVG